MGRGVLVVLCVLAFAAGEGGVLLKTLPLGYAVVVAVVCAGLGWLCLRTGGTSSASRGETSLIEDTWEQCPWMSEDEVLYLQQAFGGEADVETAAWAAWFLVQRAQQVGDESGADLLCQRYLEVVACQQMSRSSVQSLL